MSCPYCPMSAPEQKVIFANELVGRMALRVEGTMEECIFCQIVKGEVPASVVYEDDLTLAFMDIGHVNPGHTIVALKPHIENIYGLDDTLSAAVFRTATRLAHALKTPCSRPV